MYNHEPTYLSRWSEHEWRDRLLHNSSSLVIAVDEVMRVVRVGGDGRGMLLV